MYDALLVATAVLYGLAGGVFYAFSTFVSSALARLSAPEGIRAMQAVNTTAVRPPFLALFLGAPLVGVVTAVLAIGRHDWLVVVAAVVHVAGTVVVTGTANVPLNERLAALDADDELTHPVWVDYLVRWVRWNHVRTVAGAVACGLVAAAALANGAG